MVVQNVTCLEAEPSSEPTQEERLETVRKELQRSNDHDTANQMIAINLGLGDQTLGVYDRYLSGSKVVGEIAGTSIDNRRALQALVAMPLDGRAEIIR